MIDVEATLEQYKPLAKAMARRLHYRIPGLDLDDAYQLVRIEMLRAARLYEPDRGCTIYSWLRRGLTHMFSHEIKQSRQLRRQCAGVTSIDSGGHEGEPIEIASETPSPVERSEMALFVANLKAARKALGAIEQDVIDRRYLKGETLQQVGDRYGYTREWARLVEVRALEKLRTRLRRQE